MFEAFGVDRRKTSDLWTGEESLDEVTANGTVSQDPAMAAGLLGDADMPSDLAAGEASAGPPAPATTATRAPAKPAQKAPPKDAEAKSEKAKKVADKNVERADRREAVRINADDEFGGGGRAGMIAMRKVWFKVPSISTFDGTSPNITKAIAAAETALAAAPDSREKHRALVQALSYAGEIERAQTVAQQWLERDRLDPQALGYQADLIGRTGDRETALRVLSGLVDLNADAIPMHERMVRAYEQSGRLSQACSHRIAVASIQTKDAKAAGQAVRCLRSLGRQADSELVLSALPDAAARSVAEKAATAPAPAPAASRDLSITGNWSGGEDLDITLVAPDGSRISWMGGRVDATASDVTSSSTEKLGLRTLKKGNYLVEVTRKDGGRMTRGTIEITAIGAKKSIPFELSGTRTVVARVNIGMQSRLERVWR
jgi:tetratricopeptide (TPR) repeat protein